MEPVASQTSSLGNLATNVRSRNISAARAIVIAVGVLIAIFNGIQVVNARSFAQSHVAHQFPERQGQRRPGPIALRRLEDRIVARMRMLGWAQIAMACFFIVLGLLIPRHPIAISLTALVVYIGVTATLAALDPKTLAGGTLVVTITVTVVLVKALQVSLATRKAAAA